MNKEECEIILTAFLLANTPKIITQEEFDEVKKAIKQLQQENEELKEENFNLREYINIDKMSVPYKSDSFEELMTMPTYKKLEQQLDLYKSILDEIREYIEKHKMIACDEFEYISTSPDTMLQILDKATEQKW